VLGAEVLVIVVPPWNRRDVYQFQERFYIRKGTNVFVLRPEEVKSMHTGKAVV
jgi:predicted HTH transcriptional regulator